jgi:hypothetical protein
MLFSRGGPDEALACFRSVVCSCPCVLMFLLWCIMNRPDSCGRHYFVGGRDERKESTDPGCGRQNQGDTGLERQSRHGSPCAG